MSSIGHRTLVINYELAGIAMSRSIAQMVAAAPPAWRICVYSPYLSGVPFGRLIMWALMQKHLRYNFQYCPDFDFAAVGKRLRYPRRMPSCFHYILSIEMDGLSLQDICDFVKNYQHPTKEPV